MGSVPDFWVQKKRGLSPFFWKGIPGSILVSLSLIILAQLQPVMALPESNSIEFSNCTLLLPGTTRTTQARCGWLDVPENPEDPQSRQIKLHVALAPAAARNPAPDPLFVFAGGPGQAASEAYVILQPILQGIRKDRDIVLIDQRGTGQSNPLRCPMFEDVETLETAVDLELTREQTGICLEGLDGDPRFYTTTIAMQDYDKVRAAMGYETINLYGGSYGTRTAQVYLRLFPQRVRSIILDSVVPMDLILGSEHAMMLDRSVEETFTACKSDPDCNHLYGEGIDGLAGLFRDLREAPIDVDFTHPATGKQDTLTVTPDVLAVAIRFLSYSSETQAVLPLLISEAVTNGDLQRLASQAWMVLSGLSEQLSRGMELSVICSEDYPKMQDSDADTDTILGNNFLEVMKTSCGVWPQGDVPVDFHEPVSSDVPVLIITGTRDPVTPPSYADRTAESFSNSVVLKAQGLGHSVITNVCLRDIATKFISAGSLAELDTSCVAKIKPAPFFTSILGPNP